MFKIQRSVHSRFLQTKVVTFVKVKTGQSMFFINIDLNIKDHKGLTLFHCSCDNIHEGGSRYQGCVLFSLQTSTKNRTQKQTKQLLLHPVFLSNGVILCMHLVHLKNHIFGSSRLEVIHLRFIQSSYFQLISRQFIYLVHLDLYSWTMVHLNFILWFPRLFEVLAFTKKMFKNKSLGTLCVLLSLWNPTNYILMNVEQQS